jgi:CrcB protein
MNTWLAIFLGGGLGSISRYAMNKFTTLLLPLTFPFGTLFSNLLSSLILGIFLGFTAIKADQANSLRFLIAIGFCGGFSTFSAFSAETFEFIRNGVWSYAIGNMLVNVIGCLLMIGLGTWLARLW